MIPDEKNCVAVTGIGIVTPSVLSFDMITKDKLNVSEIKKIIDDIPLPQGQNSRELRRLSKLVRIAAGAADQALNMSGKSTEKMGVGVALTHGSTSYLVDFHELLYSYGADNASPSAFSNGVTNAPLSTVSTMFKLTSGGVTYTGLESSGLDILSAGAQSLLFNEYDSFLVGSAEEYSPFVEQIYAEYGWYNGRIPSYLPGGNCRTEGYPLSEGGAFMVFEPLTEETSGRAVALYQPVSDDELMQCMPDLVISGASGGPQDKYEKRLLKKILRKNNTDCVFTSAVFGNCFALSGLLSGVLACACIKSKSVLLPRKRPNPEIAGMIKEKDSVSSVLVTSASRDGQVSCGMFYPPATAHFDSAQ